MSDSDWEALSTDGTGETNASPLPAPMPPSSSSVAASANAPTARSTAASASAAHNSLPEGATPPSTAAAAAASHTASPIHRRTVLKPLCLTLNQTGTRLGVGHTTGFLVFRVGPRLPDDASPGAAFSANTAATSASLSAPPPPPQQQLTLDPQYNLDLLTFSHVRERMRQQQRRPSGVSVHFDLKASGASPAPLRSLQQQQRPDEVESVDDEESSSMENNLSPHPASGVAANVRDQHEKAAAEADVLAVRAEDLGSFLTAAGRAFAQVRRAEERGKAKEREKTSEPDSGRRSQHAKPPSLWEESRGPSRHHRKPSAPSSRTEESVSPAALPTCSEAEERNDPLDIRAATIATHADIPEGMLHADLPSLSPPPPRLIAATSPQELSPAMQWEDEDIELDLSDTASDDARTDVCLRVDYVSKQRHKRGPAGGRHEPSAEEKDGENDDDEDVVGFAGGGVSVLAFLYDQRWLALVGGGPTPMGPPHEVQFVRDGEKQHRLGVPHPVARLFLDARLLFVLTTAELRVYTNPLEREWLCLRQVIPVSGRLAARYAGLRSSPVTEQQQHEEAEAGGACGGASGTTSGANGHSPLQMWEDANRDSLVAARVDQQGTTPADAKDGESKLQEVSGNSVPTTSVATTTAPRACVPLPTIPVMVDYAHNQILLPAGEDLTGFALYRYVSGPESLPTLTAAATGVTDTQQQQQQQQQLDSATRTVTTGLTTVYVEHLATQPHAHKNSLFNLALYVGWPAATTRLWSTEENEKMESTTPHQQQLPTQHDVSGSRTAACVTLVAASSEYATRLTLWMLQEETAPQPSPLASPIFHFVLLREFRVGVRLNAPSAVMAALPSVSRFMQRSGHPPHASGTTAIHEGTSSASQAGLFNSNASLANEAGHGGTTTAAMSSSAVFSMAPSSSSSQAASGAAHAHTSTLASWAAESAAAVAESLSTASHATHSKVQHLQFLDNGAYLLCTYGGDRLRVFSTSARETTQEAKNVCRDRVAAEQNRYSRLSIMKEYLPKMLSRRLDTYTRQAWSSCDGRLPSTNSSFVPPWLYLQKQDAAASRHAEQQQQQQQEQRAKDNNDVRGPRSIQTLPSALSVASPTDSQSRIPGDMIFSHAATGRSAGVQGSGGRFFQRLTTFVGSRQAPASSPPPPQQQQQALASSHALPASPSLTWTHKQGMHSEVEKKHKGDLTTTAKASGSAPAGTWAASSPVIHATAPPSMSRHVDVVEETRQQRHTRTAAAALNGRESDSDEHVLLGWGAPLTELPQCIHIWSPSFHGSSGGSMHGHHPHLHGPLAGSHRPPVVLNCATCEGAFMSIFLLAEEGEIVTSRVVPYASE